MAKSQLNIYCDEELDSVVEELTDNGEAEHRSEAGRKLLRKGAEQYQRHKRMPPGGTLLKDAISIGTVATVIALSIGVGLVSQDVLRLAGGFGGVTLLLGIVYAAMLARARGVLT